jgi:hypothetical protein
MKTCSKCKLALPLENFHKAGGTKDGKRSYCIKCSNAYHKEWVATHKDRAKELKRINYQENAERYKDRKRVRTYGLVPGEFEKRVAEQEGACAICRSATPSGRGTWKVDHDHESGLVRGLLCDSCNQGLGRFRDDPIRLRAAASYVEKHNLHSQGVQ